MAGEPEDRGARQRLRENGFEQGGVWLKYSMVKGDGKGEEKLSGRILGRITANKEGVFEANRVPAPPIVKPLSDSAGKSPFEEFEEKVWDQVSHQVLERINEMKEPQAGNWDAVEQIINDGNLRVRVPDVNEGTYTEFMVYAAASIWQIQVFWAEKEGVGSLKDVVVYIGLTPPVAGKPYKVTHRVTIEPGPKPDEIKYMLKDAGYPFIVPGGSALEDFMLYFHADWLDHKYERCIDEETIVVSWEELKAKLGR